MNKFRKALLVLICLSAILLSINLPIHARSPHLADPILLAQQPASANSVYERAKAELPEEFYMLYRVVERLARANGLDTLPWRVNVAHEYSVNAFATDYNLLAFYTGLLDQMHGDPNALAFVAAHEMGHHIRNHIAVGEAEQQRILGQFRQEAIDQVAAEQEDLRGDLEKIRVGEWATAGGGTLIDSITSRTGGLGSLLANVLGGVFQGNRERCVRPAAERIDEINAQKAAEVKQQWMELSHRQEFEADESGYLYTARAGFDTQGATTAMEVLNRAVGSRMAGSTHPAIPDRIAKLTAIKSQYPVQPLVAEGKAKLAASAQPLTYAASLDQSSLRINSKTGSSGSFEDELPR